MPNGPGNPSLPNSLREWRAPKGDDLASQPEALSSMIAGFCS